MRLLGNCQHKRQSQAAAVDASTMKSSFIRTKPVVLVIRHSDTQYTAFPSNQKKNTRRKEHKNELYFSIRLYARKEKTTTTPDKADGNIDHMIIIDHQKLL
ncbi:hypothetical protein Tsp_03519 [Trichinella spiralis]|uniref:hypothetical protein n=1 Tax=Trichinella spiralis TaxID=6334 RepID=UPI0001EFB423|nr:hypothetical protein Tsp_03519 [Trichinella spiralis]